MRQSAIDGFVVFSKRLEGWANWMHLDTLGLVSCGMGNKCDASDTPSCTDPASCALILPWLTGPSGPPGDPTNDTGSPADEATVRSNWQTVKARQDLCNVHDGGACWRPLTNIHLSDDGIKQFVTQQIAANEVGIRQAFPNYDNWPADAQLAIMSMAWARGAVFPGFGQNRYPKLTASLQQGDFATAATQCLVNPNVGTIVLRNAANAHLFNNAATTQTNGLDLDHLSFQGWDSNGAAIWDDPIAGDGSSSNTTPSASFGTDIMGNHNAADCQQMVDNYGTWIKTLTDDYHNLYDKWCAFTSTIVSSTGTEGTFTNVGEGGALANKVAADAFGVDLQGLTDRFNAAVADFQAQGNLQQLAGAVGIGDTLESIYQKLILAVRQGGEGADPQTGDFVDLRDRLDAVSRAVGQGSLTTFGPVIQAKTGQDSDLSLFKKTAGIDTISSLVHDQSPNKSLVLAFWNSIPLWAKLGGAAVGVAVVLNKTGATAVVKAITEKHSK